LIEVTRGAKENIITKKKKATTEFAGRTYVAWYTTEISSRWAI
jgi:GLPGLI family protein